jgi:acylphosphatase
VTDEAAEKRTIRLIIRGRVHGVGFRAFVADEARRRGVAGWVRNRRDGTVEAVVAGTTAAVEEVVEACRKGPRSAWVSGVEIEEPAANPPSGTGFSVLPTV